MPENENPHLGSSFDSFLEEEGIKEEVTAAAEARVAAEVQDAEFETIEVDADEVAEMSDEDRAAYEKMVELEESAQLITLQDLKEMQRKWNQRNDPAKKKAKKKRRAANKVAKASRKFNRQRRKKK